MGAAERRMVDGQVPARSGATGIVASRRANPTTSITAPVGARPSSTWSSSLEKVATEAGVSLTALGLGFALAHPAVSSVLLGPRTPEQLEDLLAYADVRLDDDTLQAIDAIVPPGTDVNPADAGYTPHWLEPATSTDGGEHPSIDPSLTPVSAIRGL